jgi:biopolymer transport protein ExbD
MRWIVCGGALAAWLMAASTCSATPSSKRIDLSVAQDASGQCVVRWRGQPLTPKTTAELKQAAGDGAQIQVVGGAAVPYRCVGGAIYTMQAAGIDKIGFVGEPPSNGVVLTVPAGRCVPSIDGRPTTLKKLLPLAERWGKQDTEIHFQPDINASYKCVDSVLKVLKDANVGKLGFIGNEAYIPTQDTGK